MGPFGQFSEPIRDGRAVALMGVLNVTPDSFSDGGLYFAADDARRRIDALLEAGADIIDIGGESTRPRSAPVPANEQIARIADAVAYAARERRAAVSVDTTSPEVARFALARGASIVNDVSCLADPELARVVAGAGATLILMHARGSMSAMPGFSATPEEDYRDVVSEVRLEWCAARDRAIAAGMSKDRIWFDPGLGYMKSARHSLELVRRLDEFRDLGVMVVGPSRKSFLAKAAGPAEPTERLGGTIAACLACVDAGAAVLRVHDVFAVRQAVAVHSAVRRSETTPRVEGRAPRPAQPSGPAAAARPCGEADRA